MNRNEKILLAALAGMTFIAGFTTTAAVQARLKENHRRKTVEIAQNAFAQLKGSEAWKNASEAERELLIDKFTTEYIYKK
jgi:hypothetical protein